MRMDIQKDYDRIMETLNEYVINFDNSYDATTVFNGWVEEYGIIPERDGDVMLILDYINLRISMPNSLSRSIHAWGLSQKEPYLYPRHRQKPM